MNGAVNLYRGDAVAVLRARLRTGSVDMVYADPPFGNGQEWRGRAGRFSDKWRHNPLSAEGWAALRRLSNSGAALVSLAVQEDPARLAYLGAIAGIVVECRRVLKRTGTLWLHHDDTAGAQLRLLCCAIFHPTNELGTLVWRRKEGSHATTRSFPRVHDTIACYGRTQLARRRLQRLGTMDGHRFDGCATARPLNPRSAERIGYPTQKPVALLEEIIAAATKPGDLVVDVTCGSGTTLVAARRLGRAAIGIDRSSDAIRAAQRRVQEAA